MSDSLIEQVRKAANRMPIIKTVEPRPLGRRQDGIQFARPEEYDELDLRVVLAHLERMQAVVDAAREFMAADWFIDSEPMTAKELTRVRKLRVDLDAALKRMKP